MIPSTDQAEYQRDQLARVITWLAARVSAALPEDVAEAVEWAKHPLVRDAPPEGYSWRLSCDGCGRPATDSHSGGGGCPVERAERGWDDEDEDDDTTS